MKRRRKPQRSSADRAQAERYLAELAMENPRDVLRCCADTREDIRRRGIACLALGHLRFDSAIPLLTKLANDEDLSLAINSMRALSAIRSQRATSPLMEIVKRSKREEVRNAAINALGSLGDKRAERMLRGILADHTESEFTRSYAAQSLGFLGRGNLTVASLMGALQDPSPTIRWSALNSLGIIGDRRAISVIQMHLSDEAIVPSLPDHATVQDAARNALQNLGAAGTDGG